MSGNELFIKEPPKLFFLNKQMKKDIEQTSQINLFQGMLGLHFN